jgi:hypothetical protein
MNGSMEQTITLSRETLRILIATVAPAPTDKEIEYEGERDRLANPHGDDYKPKRRSAEEIRIDLRYRFADAILAGNGCAPRSR